MILEKLSNLKNEGLEEVGYLLYSLLHGFFISKQVGQSLPRPCPHQQTVIVKTVPTQPGLIHKINKRMKSSSIEQYNSLSSLKVSNSALQRCMGCLSSISTCLLALTKVRLVLPNNEDTFL